MYTILTPTIGRYRKTAIYATCVSPLETVGDRYARTSPTAVTFTVRPLPHHPDMYWNTAGVLLVHERLAAIFDAFDTPHTSRPVIFRHPITHAVLPQGYDYRLYQIETTAPILLFQPDTDGHSTHAVSVQLNPAVGDHTPRVCLDQMWPTVLCVHHTVQRCIEGRRITGGRFLRIGEAWGRLHRTLPWRLPLIVPSMGDPQRMPRVWRAGAWPRTQGSGRCLSFESALIPRPERRGVRLVYILK